MADLTRNPFLRFPGGTIILLVGLCVGAVLLARVTVNSEMDDLLSGDQRNLKSYETIRGILGESVPIAVSLDCDEVFTPQGIELIREVTWALGEIPGATTSYTNIQFGITNVVTGTNVSSLVNAVRPVFTQKFQPLKLELPKMEWVSIMPPVLDNVGLAELRRWSQEHPFARNILVAEDSRHTLILASYQRPLETRAERAIFQEELDVALQPFRDKGRSVNAIGLPLIEQEIHTTLIQDVKRFVPTALAVLLLVLCVTFRHAPRLILFMLFNQLMGIALLPALFQMTGLQLNIFTVLLVPLLTGVHLAMLAHLGTAFQRASQQGQKVAEALQTMWREVFRASGFAALTTGIGLLALLASEVDQLREFGVLGAAGITMLFGLTFGPGLAWLPVLFERQKGKAPSKPQATWGADWADRMKASYKPLLLMTMLGLVIIVVGISQVRTDVRASEFLNANSPTRKMIEEMDRVFGGINLVQVEIDSGKTNGVVEPVLLEHLFKVHQRAKTLDGVTAVYSYAQLIAAINEIYEGGKPEAFRLPENLWVRGAFIAAINSQKEQLPFLAALYDPHFRTTQLTLRTRDMPSEAYLKLLRKAEALAREGAPDDVKVSADSGIRSILEADRRIVRSQRKSVLWSVGLIGLVLAVLWRSVALAVLALAVNLLPVGLIIALQGFAGVPLNSVTIMVAAIALGIAVDDTIHFITHWRDEMMGGASASEAARRAMEVKGRPIVATTAILVGMVGVFWVSSFPPVVHFGLLLAVGLVGALVSALVLLPAWLGGRASK